MRALPTLRPYVIAPPILLELAFNDVAMADHAALIPVAERSGSDRLAFTCRSVGEALAWIMVAVSLAQAVR